MKKEEDTERELGGGGAPPGVVNCKTGQGKAWTN